MLLDGYLAGLYVVRTEGDRATLELATAHGPLSRRDEAAVEAEGLALLEFLEPDKTPTVEFVKTH